MPAPSTFILPVSIRIPSIKPQILEINAPKPHVNNVINNCATAFPV